MNCRFTSAKNSISNSPKVAKAKFMGGDRLFCLISVNVCQKGKKQVKDTWVIMIGVPEGVSTSKFALSDAEGNTWRPLNRGGLADLPLLRTL